MPTLLRSEALGKAKERVPVEEAWAKDQGLEAQEKEGEAALVEEAWGVLVEGLEAEGERQFAEY